MKGSILALFLISICNAALKSYFVDQTDKLGKYSGFYQPVKQHIGKPAQYFLCGYRFRSQKWYKFISNCNCEKIVFKLICNLCKNTFQSKTSALEAIFCHYQNWSLTKKVTFSTNSSNAGKWGQLTMCRKDFYVSGFKSRTGIQQGEYIGLTNLFLQCRNIITNQVYDTEIEKKSADKEEFIKNETSFISGFMMKYFEKGHITGFLPNFEEMPVLTFIDIQYEKVRSTMVTELLVQEKRIANPKLTPLKAEINIGKPFTTKSSHKSNDQYLTSLEISKSLQLTIPTSRTLKKFKGITENFRFNQSITTIFHLKQSFDQVIIPPMTEMIIQITIKESREVVKFKAEAMLTKKSDRTNLYVYPFQGECLGSLVSELQIKYINNAMNRNINRN